MTGGALMQKVCTFIDLPHAFDGHISLSPELLKKFLAE